MSVPPAARYTDGRINWPVFAAGTLGPKPNAAEGVAADTAAIDTQGDPPYSDDVVSHDTLEDTFGRGGASFRNSGEGVPTGSLRDAPGKAARSPYERALEAYRPEAELRERRRLAFLARVQHVDPRERRA